ncbi:ADP-ribosylglycohydrolase [Friedmanniella luteola]|uniref:ADP-ribosylglycohydrolase n=1 Tax=Friedmanniella luteola TaxID=546871 RepID=A0A1H1ZJW3_9ACTN|nr:ADP-ribosylglycohydrolase family protein [Friedmanniella luteola]SDT33516.1 ADP-ribosylglycohydrolase [Friedmanniella luteola]
MTHFSPGSSLTAAQSDRAVGVLLALACGDALGAGYEFGPPLAADVEIQMHGGGSFGWAPGEWTDDTSMAVALAEVSAAGADLRSSAAQDRVARRWVGWGREAKDVGVQTRAVFTAASAGRSGPPSAADLRAAAQELHRRTGRTGGNGSLMRTAPVALAFLHDADALVEAAMALSALTHADPEAGEACVLWCLAIRHAVVHGTVDGLRLGLDRLPAERRAAWAERLDVAEEREPSSFAHNGWVVEALQGAWSAISRTPVPKGSDGSLQPADHLRLSLEAAVRGGRDTDTVAAIAGACLGATWGASAVPSAWRRLLHGWPGLRARDLVRLGVLSAQQGRPDRAGWPSDAVVDYGRWAERHVLVRHPHDPQVWLSGVGALERLPAGVDAVVSLCRLGADEVPATGVAAGDHVEIWLIDSSDPAKNPHLTFVLHDAAAAVRQLRSEGRTVLLHCVQAQSRTPTVAALYGALLTGRPAADCLDDVLRVLPRAHPNAALRQALEDH